MFDTDALIHSISLQGLTHYYGIDWMAMLLTLVAIYLIGNKKKSGFYLMILGNLAWIILGLLTHSLAMIIANLMFAMMNIRAIYLWSEHA